MRKASISAALTLVLTVTWYIVALALALTTCIAALSAFHDFGATSEIDIPVSFEVDARALRVSAPSLGVEMAHLHDVRGSLIFPPPTGVSLVTPALLAVTVMLAITLWVLGQLRAVFRTLRDGQPFVAVNAVRIWRIGVVVIIGELARSAIVFAANSYAMTHFSANGLQFNAPPDVNIFTIIHGLIILAIAEVFRAGTRLDEDQSLTI
jgi:hypothetical protein